MPTTPEAPLVDIPSAITLFFSYSHQDEDLRRELDAHLSPLMREGLVQGWHDREISPGAEWREIIDGQLNNCRVILLLVSANFLASDYCWGVEMKRALERHSLGTARVIPIILRPCDWTKSPFGRLQALPRDAKPITTWSDRDAALLDVALGIRRAATELNRATLRLPNIHTDTSPVCPQSSSSISKLLFKHEIESAASEDAPRVPTQEFVWQQDSDLNRSPIRGVRTSMELELVGSLEDVKLAQDAILQIFRELSGDVSLTIKLRVGSVIVTVEGTAVGIERLRILIRDKALTEVAGFSIAAGSFGVQPYRRPADLKRIDAAYLHAAGFRYFAFLSYPRLDIAIREFAARFAHALEEGLANHVPTLNSGHHIFHADAIAQGTEWESLLAQSIYSSITMIALVVPSYARHEDWSGREWATMEFLGRHRLPSGPSPIFAVDLSSGQAMPRIEHGPNVYEMKRSINSVPRLHLTREFGYCVTAAERYILEVAHLFCVAGVRVENQGTFDLSHSPPNIFSPPSLPDREDRD